MSKPWKHAVSAARKFGGQPEDYLAIHTFMDTSKAAIGDNRHRVLSHHSAFLVEVLVPVFGETFKRQSDGKVMSTRDIGEQHNDEDYGGWMPTATDFINEIPLADWMFGNMYGTTAMIIKHQYKVWEELSDHAGWDNNHWCKVWRLFNYGMRHANDVRGNVMTHNAWFVNAVIAEVYGQTEVVVCMEFLNKVYGKIPTALDWVMEMPLTGWMNNGRGKAPSQAILFRQKRDNSMNRKAIDND